VNSFKELVLRNRSYRRFYEDKPVDKSVLCELIDLARLTPSAANKQPLKYYISFSKEKNDIIFPKLAFAGYLKDWSGPIEGERPSAYIVILRDRNIPYPCEVDHGIAAQTIMLGAVEKGYGGCMIAAVNKKELRKDLHLCENLEILLVLALGKPKEEVRLVETDSSGDIRYYRNKAQIHFVPKRSLREIIINL
jgi:nitroreductase